MTYDLVTIGEGQIRLSVPRGDRLLTARHLTMTPACSEANVAGLLAQLGRHTAWGSVVPAGELGDRIVADYRGVGVDVTYVKRPEHGRVALYFLEPGEAPLPARVTYDRLHTPFRDVAPEDFDWDALLDTRALFVTGITAALTDRTGELVEFAVRAARRRDVRVVLDVNHRTLLWSAAAARARLEPLLADVSVLFCSRGDAATVFGVEGTGERVCQALRDRTGVDWVVTTDRASGVYLAGPDGQASFGVEQLTVTDRPGAGDAFVAGTLHGWLDGDIRTGVGYGQRASAFALTHHGDLTHVTASELAPSVPTDIVR